MLPDVRTLFNRRQTVHILCILSIYLRTCIHYLMTLSGQMGLLKSGGHVERLFSTCFMHAPKLRPAVCYVISFLLLRTTALKPFYLFFLESNFVCEIRNTWIINGVFVSNLCLEHWTLFPLKWFLKDVLYALPSYRSYSITQSCHSLPEWCWGGPCRCWDFASRQGAKRAGWSESAAGSSCTLCARVLGWNTFQMGQLCIFMVLWNSENRFNMNLGERRNSVYAQGLKVRCLVQKSSNALWCFSGAGTSGICGQVTSVVLTLWDQK